MRREYKLEAFSGSGTDISPKAIRTNKIHKISCERYHTIEECCERVVTLFEKMNIADSLYNMTLIPTRILGKDYFKTIRIFNEVPLFYFNIKRTAPGDISMDEVREKIRLEKEKHERTNNKLRHKN